MFAHHRIPRRKFLHWLLSAFFLSAIPWCWACRRTTKNNRELWSALANTLFPGSPNIEQISFYHHLKFVLSDSNYDPDIRLAIFEGFENFTQFVQQKAPTFAKMPLEKRNQWLSTYVQTTDGAEKWLAHILTLVWEAALLDPHYGVNQKMITWKWLHHPHGTPRPDISTDYFALLKKRDEYKIYKKL